jgi:hypothetical protein
MTPYLTMLAILDKRDLVLKYVHGETTPVSDE